MSLYNVGYTILITLYTSLIIVTLVGKASHSKVRYFYALNIFCVVLWSIGMVFYQNSLADESIIYSRLLYVFSSTIPTTFYYFTLVYLYPNKNHRKVGFLLTAINIVIIYLSLYTNYIVKDSYINNKGQYIFVVGSQYYLFVIYLITLFSVSFVRLFKAYFSSKSLDRDQILYLAIGYTVSGTLASASNLILPWIGIIDLNRYGPLTTIFVVIAASYAIAKRKFFSIKIISAELLVILLWLLTAFKIVFFDNLRFNFSNIAFDLLIFILGVLLIHSIRKEVEQKEKIEIQAKQLKELDELKGEFISLATHHISSPLTAIKGYVSLLQESDSIEEFERNKGILNTVQRLTNNTVNLVKDFIDVNKIDDNKIKYEFSEFYIRELIDQVITEYEPQILRKGIKFEVVNSIDSRIMVNADKEKIHHALINILENSIKYTENGFITFNVEKENRFAHIKISDNGIRNLPTISPRLLRKLTESGNKDEANIIGNGIGVYAAKLLIEGNKGILSVKTEDSTTEFKIGLPLSG